MKRQGWRWKTLQFWPGRCHGASLPEGFQLNPFGLWFFSAAESWSGCSVSLCLFLIRCPPELSTAWTRQTENSAGTWQNNGQSEWERHGHFFHFILVYRKIFSCSYFSSEYMSSRLFWMGVPVTAHRAHALSWHTACDVCTLGFLMLWASSRITRAQVTRIRGEEEEVFGWRKKKRTLVNSQIIESDTVVKVSHLFTHRFIRTFRGFLCLLLWDWDLFGDQTVRGHHYVIISQSVTEKHLII